MSDSEPSGGTDYRRRDVLRAAGATGTASLVGLSGCLGSSNGGGGNGEKALGNYPVSGDSATFGFNVARSGTFSTAGEAELRGQKLAVKHINEGGGWVDTDKFGELSGGGLLGKTVDYRVRDTESSADAARAGARQLIREGNAIMVSGGASASTAIAQQEVAQQQKVVYMATTTNSNAVTGSGCTRYGFREMFNTYMLTNALLPVLKNTVGPNKRFFQIYADSPRGEELQRNISGIFAGASYFATANIDVQVGTTNFKPVFENLPDRIMEYEPKIVFLNLFGLDAANAVREAQRTLKEKLPDIQIVIPLMDRPMAKAAGGQIEDVIGTVAWDPAISTPLSESFTQAYQSEYNNIPPSPAIIGYIQVLQYAAAAARAGTFYPPDVIKELEDHVYAAGMGKEELRKCDHQSIRPVPSVRGLPQSEQSEGRYFELTRKPTRKVGYPCDPGTESVSQTIVPPSGQCELGSYGESQQ
jgi:ABC-type branched-subunit amino acid transport system substrate-binding protein